MESFRNQLYPLIKKNWTLKGKSKIKILIEILSPLIAIGILFGLLYLSMIITRDFNERPASGFAYDIAHTKQLLIGANGGLTFDQRRLLDNLKLQVKTQHPEYPNEYVDRCFVEFKDMESMDAYFHDPENVRGVMGGVWFEDGSFSGNSIRYSIKVDSDFTQDNTKQYRDRDDSQIYLRHYFTQIQTGVDQAILLTNNIEIPIFVTGQRFPNPYISLWEKWTDGRKMILINTGGVFITASLFITLFTLITNMVIEKETKILEGMKTMGLNSLAYYISNSIISLVTLIPSTILVSIIISATQLVHHVNWITLILILFPYSITLLLIAFILCKFFTKSKYAGLIGFLVVLVLSGIGIIIGRFDISPKLKLVSCLISPVAISIANYVWCYRDLIVFKEVDVNTNFMIGEYEIVGMLFLDIFIYIIILWYLDNIITGEFGISKRWYFFLTRNYWRKHKQSNHTGVFDIESEVCNRNGSNNEKDFEKFLNPQDIKPTISIRNLRKEFNTGDGKRVAVNDLSIDMYKNQIHSFLGPNGSGKSTTLSMLTGLIKPTSGDALINGFDIKNNIDEIRKYLGVCPQTDIIWEQLTVFEHLEFYAALKGYKNSNQRKVEATKIAMEVGLDEKLNAPAGSLSGGQKRKLCLAIAFIGPNSDIILIDEPTSGLDASNRRLIWDFILKYRENKTIILTTHYLDESDILSDRISIIANGELKCNGSSLFLKNRFGVGYLLTISKEHNSINNSSLTKSISDIVLKHIPKGSLLSDAGTELCFRLPNESIESFSNLFVEFDSKKTNLSIENYGISITTLEEVFLKIISNSGANPNFNQSILNTALQTTSSGIKSRQQFKGLLIKRITTSRKDFKSFILSIIIPLLILGGGLILYKNMRTINIYNTVTTPLLLDFNVYGDKSMTPISIDRVNDTMKPVFDNTMGHSNRTTLVPYEQLHNYLIHHFFGVPGALYFDFRYFNDIKFLHYNVFFNKDYLHALPIYINYVDSEILRSYTGKTIQTTSLPFEHIKTQIETASLNVNFVAIVFFIILTLASFSLISASHAGNISHERSTRVKRLLYISGLKKSIYWLSNLIWDYIQTFVLVLFLTIVIVAVDDKFRTHFDLYISGVVLFTFAIIPLSYLMSFKFSSHGKAVGAIFAINFGVGLIFTVISFILRIWAIKESSYSFQSMTDIIEIHFFVLSPFFCFSKILTIITNFPGITRVDENHIDNYWGFHFGLLPNAILFGHCLVWIVWILLIDYSKEINGRFKIFKTSNSPNPDSDEDSDVSAERLRVKNLLNKTIGQGGNIDGVVYPIIIENLYKKYDSIGKYNSKIAVENSSLAIPTGQTFGLLGLNGCGKSTTLGIVSGEIPPTGGKIKLNGYDLFKNRKDALGSIGYCFQFDALIGLLSAREQLELYCRIKGVEESNIKQTVDAFIQMMDLEAISNSNTSGYSGGNKRKVSLSIACIGSPSILLLDEISCGVDACVKRFMWNVITELKRNKAIILTTHSIAECQAVCDKLTIMKDGKLKALGSNQHIKDKFGSGYSIEVKFKKEYFENGVELFKLSFPSAMLIDNQHGLSASFELPNPPNEPINLSTIFSNIEQSLKYILDDYSVSQTSIEQIFIKLTKNNDHLN
ncbi:hypothetical protein RB653_001849 [Dictyostelium firmibasis]|uniref:ABC transporter domain-containing protein n=1 Tax=Dictyostelium firmibasis TaxID=79012 RepID=A0AAN7TVF6_9MYCE